MTSTTNEETPTGHLDKAMAAAAAGLGSIDDAFDSMTSTINARALATSIVAESTLGRANAHMVTQVTMHLNDPALQQTIKNAFSNAFSASQSRLAEIIATQKNNQ